MLLFWFFFADKSPFRAAGGRNTPVGQRALTENNATDRTNKKESAAKPKDLYCIYFLFLLLYLTQSFRQIGQPQSFQEDEIKARISFSILLIRFKTRWSSMRKGAFMQPWSKPSTRKQNLPHVSSESPPPHFPNPVPQHTLYIMGKFLLITQRTELSCSYNEPEARVYGNVKKIKRWEYGLLEIKYTHMIAIKIIGRLIIEIRNF